jgi:hypothetical protein
MQRWLQPENLVTGVKTMSTDALGSIDQRARSEYDLYLAGRKTPQLASITPGQFKKCPYCTGLGRVGLVRKEMSGGYLCCDQIVCNYKERVPPQTKPKQVAPVDDNIQFQHGGDIGGNPTESTFGPLVCASKSETPLRQHISSLRGKSTSRRGDRDLPRNARVLEEEEYHFSEGGWTRVI